MVSLYSFHCPLPLHQCTSMPPPHIINDPVSYSIRLFYSFYDSVGSIDTIGIFLFDTNLGTKVVHIVRICFVSVDRVLLHPTQPISLIAFLIQTTCYLYRMQRKFNCKQRSNITSVLHAHALVWRWTFCLHHSPVSALSWSAHVICNLVSGFT